ncbi:hypothetical protein RHS03_09993, partial [Rhizoctonia solani]
TQTVAQLSNQSAAADPGRPTFFDKGKWISNKDFDAQQAYKAAKSRTDDTMPKKDQPSIGITLDDIRPPRKAARQETLERSCDRSSIAALPAGGYFANKMRAKGVAMPSTSKKEKSAKKRAYSPSESKSKSRSSSSPESSNSDKSTTLNLSLGLVSSRKRWKNKKKREEYRLKEKMRKEQCKKHKLQRQIWELIQASIKVKELVAYQGQDNYNPFEKWDYKVDHWLQASRYKGKCAVEHLGMFLSGNALRWYMDFVAPDPKSYMVDTLKMGLFSYFFPPNLKSKLCCKFKYAQQGNQKFVNYLQALKQLQRQLPDITDRNICNKLWDTVHTYIKVKWIKAGLDEEETDLDILTKMAERFEAAKEAKQRASAQGKPKGNNQQNGGGSITKQTNKPPKQNLKGKSSKQNSTPRA